MEPIEYYINKFKKTGNDSKKLKVSEPLPEMTQFTKCLATWKRKYGKIELNDDGQYHKITRKGEFFTISLVVPDIVDYWLNQVELANNEKMNSTLYVFAARKLSKFFYKNFNFDYIRSIGENPQERIKVISLINDAEFQKIMSKYVDTELLPNYLCTSYRIFDGGVTVYNSHEKTYDKYKIQEDCLYSAKGYTVLRNVDKSNDYDNDEINAGIQNKQILVY